MLAEQELTAIEQLIDGMRRSAAGPEQRQWITRCLLLAREVRRLKSELDRAATVNLGGASEDSSDTVEFQMP
jgi:hypothetical protein